MYLHGFALFPHGCDDIPPRFFNLRGVLCARSQPHIIPMSPQTNFLHSLAALHRATNSRKTLMTHIPRWTARWTLKYPQSKPSYSPIPRIHHSSEETGLLSHAPLGNMPLSQQVPDHAHTTYAEWGTRCVPEQLSPFLGLPLQVIFRTALAELIGQVLHLCPQNLHPPAKPQPYEHTGW